MIEWLGWLVHLFDPETVFRLQHATRSQRYDVYRDYTTAVDERSLEAPDPDHPLPPDEPKAKTEEKKKIAISGSIAVIDVTHRTDALIGDGGDIAGLPRQVFAGEAALRLPGGIWAGPTVRAASRSWVDHANTLSAPGYAIYGIKINQALAGGVEWFIEGRNLADKSYAATTGVIRNAGGADQAQFNPGEGRAVYVGVSKTF